MEVTEAACAGGLCVVCRTGSTAWGWKSPAQPGGGEGLEKRKGAVVRRGLKEAWIKGASR